MHEYKPIECGSYDILEVVCMENYEIELITANETLHGTATTLKRLEDGEYLVLTVSGGNVTNVRADHIEKINVMTRPCRFTTFDFK